MVDKKLSDFGSIQPSDVSDFVVLYLDENLSPKNGRLPFNSFVSMLALLPGNNEFKGDNTFSGDVVFEETATFNKGINGTAARATADASGHNIENTYATKTELDQKSSFKLFHHDWFDYQLNDMSWLRADTFSWQDGTAYSDAYNHLLDDWNTYWADKDPDVLEDWQSERIDRIEILYITAADGHKICHPDQEFVINLLYNATGVAWYYILDTENQRFKLPRELPITDKSKGNGIALGWTDGTNNYGSIVANGSGVSGRTTAYGEGVGGTGGTENIATKVVGLTTDSTKSGIISHRANENGQQYLYFYVGQFSQSATEQTAGLNTEMFNNKVDLDGHNATFAHIVETYQNGSSWYRVYSDGWCEQGGIYDNGSDVRSIETTITFLKQFTDTNYNFQAQGVRDTTGYHVTMCGCYAQTNSSIDVICYGFNDIDLARYIKWYACGYIG